MSEEFSVTFKSGGCSDCNNCGLCGKKTNENLSVVTDSAVSKKEAALSAFDVNTVAAIDLGTTTIAMFLLDAQTGEQIGVYTGLNPQALKGTDVISRISHALAGEQAKLQEMIIEALENGIEKLSSGKPKPELVVVSGNTVMGHLLMGYDVSKLGVYPFVPVNILKQETKLCGIKTILMPGISAFVGGDIVSGLFTLDFIKKDKPALLIDLGTNAEMVLGCAERLIATSAAAGPAFEQKYYATRLISGVAKLLREGIIDENGTLCDEYFESGITIDRTQITQKDIRSLQEAKAGVLSGILILAKEYQVSLEDINEVFIAGGLGYYLNLEDAFTIGLLPKQFRGKVKVVGNTSLEGAVKYASGLYESDKVDGILSELVGKTKEMNLAEYEGFQDVYIAGLNF